MLFPRSPFEQIPSLAVDFNAASESYSFGDLATVPSSDVDFTIETWNYFTSLAGFKEYVGKATSTTGWYLLVASGGGTNFQIAFDDARVAALGNTQAVNIWTYHCWVHRASANTVQGYHGIESDLTLTTGTLTSSIAGPTASTGAMRIGSQDPFPTDGGIVRLALVRMWREALTTEQLQQTWNKRFLPINCPFPGLAFLWDANLDAGVAPFDLLTQTVGTLVGSPGNYFQGPALDWIVQLPEWLIEAAAGGTTYTQSVAGTVTGSGALLKQARKLPGGTLTGSGALLRQTGKGVAGTLTGSGALLKQTQQALTGTLTGSGSLIKQANKLLAGTLTGSGALTKQTRKSFGGTVTGSGSLMKQVRKGVAGTLSGSGTLSTVKVFLMAVGGTLTGAGTLLKQTRTSLAGTLTGSGLLTKQTRTPVSGTLTGSGALTKQTGKAIGGSLASSGSLTKRIAKTIGGVLSGSGLLAAIKSGTASIIGLIKALFSTSTPGASFDSGTPGADIDSENE